MKQDDQSDTDMREDEDQDPVVSEIPVYLNRLQDPPFMCGEIYGLLNSLRPADRPYGDQGEMRSVELDDSRHRLRLNYSVRSSNGLDEHSLVGIPRDSSNATYCMGVFGEDSLTLIPLTAVCTMRPSFAHVDEEVLLRRGSVVVEEEAARALTGKALYYQDLARSLRRNDATWRPLDSYPADSPEAADLFTQYIVPSHSLPSTSFRPISTHEYLVELAACTTGQPGTRSDVSRLDFARQIETLMKQVVVTRFVDFLALLPPNTRARHSDADILTKLESFALLVQGVWILHSNLSAHRPHLWDTRDGLLLLLHAGRDITVQTLSAIAQLVREEIEEILLPICQLDIISNTWRLKVKPDEQFVRLWPQIARQQEAAIARLIAQLKRAKLGNARTTSHMNVRSILVDGGALTTEEVRAALQAQNRDHLVSEANALEALRAAGALPVAERWTLADRTGVPRIDALRQRLIELFRTRDSLSANELVDCQDLNFSEIRRVLKEFANPAPGGVWVRK